jgi:tRNA threonylcarbamoyladenosine biosynthesis protein TsaB
VRIATAAAQGIALGRDLPMLGISSLACLAQGSLRRYREGGGHAEGVEIRVAIDARMGEIYRASYHASVDGTLHPGLGEGVVAPAFPPANGPWLACGTGFGRYPALCEGVAGLLDCEPEALPHAQDALALVARSDPQTAWIAADAAVPEYLRDQVTS